MANIVHAEGDVYFAHSLLETILNVRREVISQSKDYSVFASGALQELEVIEELLKRLALGEPDSLPENQAKPREAEQ